MLLHVTNKCSEYLLTILVGALERFLFFSIQLGMISSSQLTSSHFFRGVRNVIIPVYYILRYHIFQMGRYTTNHHQPVLVAEYVLVWIQPGEHLSVADQRCDAKDDGRAADVPRRVDQGRNTPFPGPGVNGQEDSWIPWIPRLFDVFSVLNCWSSTFFSYFHCLVIWILDHTWCLCSDVSYSFELFEFCLCTSMILYVNKKPLQNLISSH